MPRTTVTAQALPGSYPSLQPAADSLDVTWGAGDNVNGDEVTFTDGMIVLVRNDNAGAQTVTVTSVVDEKNRTGDVTTYSVGASEYAALGPFKAAGWRQTDGMLYLDCSSADIKYLVLSQ